MKQVLDEHTLPTGQQLQLVQGDLTEEETGAIVNAANRNLQHGGGVAGAIVRAGGREIQRQSDEWVREHGPVPHDEPAYTTAGELPSRYVIHAVGPVWEDGSKEQKEKADGNLASAVQGALRRADQLDLNSISFPAISTGIYGFPKARAAGVMLDAIQDYFKKNTDSEIQQLRLVLYDQPTRDAFQRVWQEKF